MSYLEGLGDSSSGRRTSLMVKTSDLCHEGVRCPPPGPLKGNVRDWDSGTEEARSELSGPSQGRMGCF